MNRKFIWLLDSCSPRRGPALVKRETYAEDDFPPGVAAEWVKAKAAKWASEPKAAKIKEKE